MDFTKNLSMSKNLAARPASYRTPYPESSLDAWEDLVVVAIRRCTPGSRRPSGSVGAGYLGATLMPLAGGGTAIGSSKIDDALKATDAAFTHELIGAGLPSSAVELLRAWIDLQVEARVAKSALETARLAVEQSEPPVARSAQAQPRPVLDILKGLSAVELGERLGISDERVRQREKAGEFFSVLPLGRQRGREYPAFQAHPRVTGAPLQAVLRVLGDAGTGASGAYGFFTGINPDLAELTPVEVLLGELLVARPTNEGADQLLKLSVAERSDLVIQAAGYFAAGLAA